MESAYTYIYLDGDSIGDRLELLLLEDKIEDAAAFSRSVISGMDQACQKILQTPDTSIIFSGGDDLLAKYSEGKLSAEYIEEIRRDFLTATGCTISGGRGKTPKEAVQNLHKAKLLGKNRVV